jgi:4-amino-4-deoxy-L-arabinose transferase-like glycosyltransferase
LPSVLAALGCVLATIGIGRELAGRRTALLAGGALALTLEFFRRTREVSLDLWQAMFLLLAMLLIVRGAGRGRAGLIVAAGVPVGLALLCKPLVGLVLLPIAAIWLVSIGRARAARWLAGTLAAALAVAAPWHVSMIAIHGAEFTGQYFGAEIADRASGQLQAGHAAPIPPWFYLAQIAARGWPWLLFVILGAVSWIRGLRPGPVRAWRFGVIWTLAWLVMLSAFADRRDRYAIPLHPGLAILAALWLGHTGNRFWASGVRWGIRWLPPIVVGVGVLIAVLPIRIDARPAPQWPELFAWMRAEGLEERGAERVWQGAFIGSRGARVYLEFGWWPMTTRDRLGDLIAAPPEGALLLYHRRDGWRPGGNETVLFSSGDLTATRLGEGGWRPVVAPDPGE